MERIEASELKQIQLTILDEVVKICQEYSINYWIDCGTLLGAIRHGGYIPWDDDIDIGMLRTDYDKFCSLFNKVADKKYRLKNIDTDRFFYLPFSKVLDTTTLLIEPNLGRIAVNIDIFPYDNISDNDVEAQQAFDIRDDFRKKWYMNNKPLHFRRNIFKLIFSDAIRRFIFVFFENKKINSEIIENCKKSNNINTKRIGNLSGWARMVCDKRAFESFVDVTFEGKKYKAPIGYDEYLKAFYGNYMELPPPEKRVTHHVFTAYKK